jgi:hypothetical protein
MIIVLNISSASFNFSFWYSYSKHVKTFVLVLWSLDNLCFFFCCFIFPLGFVLFTFKLERLLLGYHKAQRSFFVVVF